MFFSSAHALVALSALSVVQATTDKCNADNCLRAVRASGCAPFVASASKDCAAAFVKTVTVTPSAITSSFGASRTGSVVVVTSTTSTSTTLSVTESQTSYTTATQVVGTTQVSSIPETITELTTSTVFYEDVQTTTVTTQGLQSCPAKPQRLARNADVDTRVVTYTKPRTPVTKRAVASSSGTAPSGGVPTYASACSGIFRYSSACSCIGVTASTETVTAQPSTISTTIYSTSTPTSVATSTQVITSTITYTTTILSQLTASTISTEISLTTFPITITSTISESTTVQSTFTSTVTALTPNVCCFQQTAPTCAPDPGFDTPTQCKDGTTCMDVQTCNIAPSMDECFSCCSGGPGGCDYGTFTFADSSCRIGRTCCKSGSADP